MFTLDQLQHAIDLLHQIEGFPVVAITTTHAIRRDIIRMMNDGDAANRGPSDVRIFADQRCEPNHIELETVAAIYRLEFPEPTFTKMRHK